MRISIVEDQGGGGGLCSAITRPSDRSAYLKIVFLISQPLHMLWVLKRAVSMRRFF